MAGQGDTRYLMRQGQTFYAVVEVPPSLREKLGNRLKRTLRTRDITLARARRWHVVADLKAQIEAARRGHHGDPIEQEALAYRGALADAAKRPDGDPEDGYGGSEWGLKETIASRAETLEREHGEQAAVAFADLALGRTTPLSAYVETWLAEGGPKNDRLKERTKLERRRAVEKLAAWLRQEQLPPTIEGVSRRIAGRYVSEVLLPSGRDRVTLGKAVRSLRAYWHWLRQRGHVDEEGRNPWDGQVPSGPSSSSGEPERPFTAAEVKTLLNGPADRTLREFMLVAALSGMRREEIGQLRISDCADGVFVVQGGKTAAARRRVPIHSALAAIVEGRTRNKAAKDYLFDDLTPGKNEQTDPIGKLFTRYRRSLGVQDGTGRRSLVNFHSWRRWFDTAALNAGQPPHFVSLVMGHAEGRKGMTLGPYWGGAEDDALRAVVEAVKLPQLALTLGDH